MTTVSLDPWTSPLATRHRSGSGTSQAQRQLRAKKADDCRDGEKSQKNCSKEGQHAGHGSLSPSAMMIETAPVTKKASAMMLLGEAQHAWMLPMKVCPRLRLLLGTTVLPSLSEASCPISTINVAREEGDYNYGAN